jgi:hypothetical protein
MDSKLACRFYCFKPRFEIDCCLRRPECHSHADWPVGPTTWLEPLDGDAQALTPGALDQASHVPLTREEVQLTLLGVQQERLQSPSDL